MTRVFTVLCLTACWLSPQSAVADWPMPGHDPRRTSYSAELLEPCTSPRWHVEIDAYIPSRSHIVTQGAYGNVPASIYVTAADGIHALNPLNGWERWVYRMDMPPGEAPTIVGDTAFVAGTDGTVHAIDAADGSRRWRTGRAGSPFYVNPLVVDGRVYVGNRDGFFYCFDASDGKLIWHRQIGERVSFSAAFADHPDYPKGLVVFAAEDRRAYALSAENGEIVWSSSELPGASFAAFWPVVTRNRVLLASSSIYPSSEAWDLTGLAREEVLLEEKALPAVVDGRGLLDLRRHVEWLQKYPQRQSLLVLDVQTGAPAETPPALWWGNPGGQRYPPAIGADGVIWTLTPWVKSWFGRGRYVGWKPGSTLVRTVPGLLQSHESADEPEAFSIIGGHIYHNDGGDGADKGGVFNLAGGDEGSWGIATLYDAFGEYWGAWKDRKYGNSLKIKNPNNMWANSVGSHGHQNPPVPLNGRVYFHRSNAVICMEPKRNVTRGSFPRAPRSGRRSVIATGREREAVSPSPTDKAEDLPTVLPLRARLSEEIQRMIDAGHLAPGLALFHQHYRHDTRDQGWELDDYWHNPAELVYTLSIAIPHLPEPMQEAAKDYLQMEFNRYPPSEYIHMGPEGARREGFALPPEMGQMWPSGYGQREEPATSADWKGWTFNPFNIYACFKYSEIFPNEARKILDQVRTKVAPLPDDVDFLHTHPHVLNAHIAGYFGFLQLQDLVDEPRSAEVAAWLSDALRTRVEILADDPASLPAAEAGGFMWLVPELGDFLHEHANDRVQEHARYQNWAAPNWFIAGAQEVTRIHSDRGLVEGDSSHVYEYMSQFQVRAFALKWSAEQLEAHLDTRSVPYGDLYYIQNLCATISAHQN